MIFLADTLYNLEILAEPNEKDALNSEALNFIDKAISILQSRDDDSEPSKHTKVQASHVRGRILISMKRLDEAKIEFDSIKKLSEEIRNDK